MKVRPPKIMEKLLPNGINLLDAIAHYWDDLQALIFALSELLPYNFLLKEKSSLKVITTVQSKTHKIINV